MDSIMDMSTMTDTYQQSLSSAAAFSVENTISNLSSSSTDEELLDACKEFEVYFVQKILEQAFESTKMDDDEDEEDGSEYLEYFGSMLTEQYATAIVDSETNGLAQQLYESMKNTYSI